MFILGYQVIVLTDHQALTFLFQCRLRNARLTRWTLHLQESDLQVKHIPGSENVIDALSRNPVGRDETETFMSGFPCILTMTPRNIKAELERQISGFKTIFSSQKKDMALAKIIQQLRESHNQQMSFLDHYCLVEDVFFTVDTYLLTNG